MDPVSYDSVTCWYVCRPSELLALILPVSHQVAGMTEPPGFFLILGQQILSRYLLVKFLFPFV